MSDLRVVPVNHTDAPFALTTDHFAGHLEVRIKNFSGENPPGVEAKSDSEYFAPGSYGSSCTWSIAVQGRFDLDGLDADRLVFGNEFDKPIKDSLPYGTGLALQFFKVIDPNLKHDLYADKPWAFSPLLATMNRTRASRDDEQFPLHVTEDLTPLLTNTDGSLNNDIETDKNTVDNMRGGEHGVEKAHEFRRRWFSHQNNRQKVKVTKDVLITSDFCNGFIDFNTLSLNIPFSGGMSWDCKLALPFSPVREACPSDNDLRRPFSSGSEKVLGRPACSVRVQGQRDGNRLFRHPVSQVKSHCLAPQTGKISY